METEVKIHSVSEINRSIKNLIAERKEFKGIWVQGEISNYSSSGNGHIYFSLKDHSSIIRCTFFAGVNQSYRGKKLQNGLEIQIYGSVTVYEPQGSYSINVLRVQELGQGDLLKEKEMLRRKLHDEGLFDALRKKQFPLAPKVIGVATSFHGAALEDIIKTVRNRNERINILIAPCLVQGEAAPRSIIGAIRELCNPKWKVDVIIAGRGGGSAEDLMAFDQEAVVRTFADCPLPIVSAVGHEVDNALTDFAADHYAATPTAAAEFVTPDLEAELDSLNALGNRLNQALGFKLKSSKERFQMVKEKYVFEDPMQILFDRYQRVDDLIRNLQLLGNNFLSKKQSLFSKFDNLSLIFKAQMEKHKRKYEILGERIENFSPLGTLKRGFSVVRDSSNKVIQSNSQVKIGDNLEIILDEGRLQVEVRGKTK